MISIEKIIASAIKFQMKDSDYFHIMTGLRHADIFYEMYQLHINYNRNTHIQGFLTSKDRFVNRHEAAEIAFMSKQIEEEVYTLFSEDIWPE